MPDSLTTISVNAFVACVKLTNNVMPINLHKTESASFNGAWGASAEGIDLKLGAHFISDGVWGPWSFFSSGINSVQIGSASNRITRFSMDVEQAPSMFSASVKNWIVYVKSGSGISEAMVRDMVWKWINGTPENPSEYNITVDIG